MGQFIERGALSPHRLADRLLQDGRPGRFHARKLNPGPAQRQLCSRRGSGSVCGKFPSWHGILATCRKSQQGNGPEPKRCHDARRKQKSAVFQSLKSSERPPIYKRNDFGFGNGGHLEQVQCLRDGEGWACAQPTGPWLMRGVWPPRKKSGGGTDSYLQHRCLRLIASKKSRRGGSSLEAHGKFLRCSDQCTAHLERKVSLLWSAGTVRYGSGLQNRRRGSIPAKHQGFRMPHSENSGGLISEEELVVLTDLFGEFEGAPDPRSQKCKEAKIDFNNLVSELYFKRVQPLPEYQEWTSSQFHSVIRNACRGRLSQTGPRFPCP